MLLNAIFVKKGPWRKLNPKLTFIMNFSIFKITNITVISRALTATQLHFHVFPLSRILTLLYTHDPVLSISCIITLNNIPLTHSHTQSSSLSCILLSPILTLGGHSLIDTTRISKIIVQFLRCCIWLIIPTQLERFQWFHLPYLVTVTDILVLIG